MFSLQALLFSTVFRSGLFVPALLLSICGSTFSSDTFFSDSVFGANTFGFGCYLGAGDGDCVTVVANGFDVNDGVSHCHREEFTGAVYPVCCKRIVYLSLKPTCSLEIGRFCVIGHRKCGWNASTCTDFTGAFVSSSIGLTNLHHAGNGWICEYVYACHGSCLTCLLCIFNSKKPDCLTGY